MSQPYSGGHLDGLAPAALLHFGLGSAQPAVWLIRAADTAFVHSTHLGLSWFRREPAAGHALTCRRQYLVRYFADQPGSYGHNQAIGPGCDINVDSGAAGYSGFQMVSYSKAPACLVTKDIPYTVTNCAF